jgi:addiction module HigA family antidote
MDPVVPAGYTPCRVQELEMADYHQREQTMSDKLPPIHPGEVLLEEFLQPLGVTQVAFAAHLGVPVQRVNQLVKGKRGVTPETAWLLSQALGTTPEFWLNLQSRYDLERTQHGRVVAPLRESV